MNNSKIISSEGLSSGYVISKPEHKTEMKIVYDTPEGKMSISIPHPPMLYYENDIQMAMFAMIIGLAVKAGIKPEKIGEPDDDN